MAISALLYSKASGSVCEVRISKHTAKHVWVIEDGVETMKLRNAQNSNLMYFLTASEFEEYLNEAHDLKQGLIEKDIKAITEQFFQKICEQKAHALSSCGDEALVAMAVKIMEDSNTL